MKHPVTGTYAQCLLPNKHNVPSCVWSESFCVKEGGAAKGRGGATRRVRHCTCLVDCRFRRPSPIFLRIGGK
jgi:hypothetical protein